MLVGKHFRHGKIIKETTDDSTLKEYLRAIELEHSNIAKCVNGYTFTSRHNCLRGLAIMPGDVFVGDIR